MIKNPATLRIGRSVLVIMAAVLLLGAAISFGAGGANWAAKDSATAKSATGNAVPASVSKASPARTLTADRAGKVANNASSQPASLNPDTQDTFSIPSSVIAGGGGSSSSVSPNFGLVGTAGQALAGTTSSNGQFSVTGGFWQQQPLSTVAISGTILYCPASGSVPVPNASLALSGDATANTTTNASGAYSFVNLVPGSYTVTPSKPNLVTGSAGIDSADVVAVRRHALGSVLLSGCRLSAGNANGDVDGMGNDIVDSADIVPIRRFALGLATGIANVGQWHFTPTSRSYISIITDQTNQDYNALAIGDASGDLTPTSPSTSLMAPESIAAVAQVSFPVASVATPSVTNFSLPVNTTTIPAGDNLVAFQGDFTFDPTVVTFQAPAVSKAGLTAGAIWTVQANLCPPGTTCTPTLQTLRVIGDSDGSIPLSGSGVLFNLNFVRASTTVGASTALTWAASPNEFRFVEGNNFTRVRPGATPPGSITIGNAPSASNGMIAGHVANVDGTPVSGAVIRLTGTQNRKTITDSDGNYHFDNVETNGFYTVTPSRANYAFSPSQRAFSQIAETTEATFGGAFTGDSANPLDTPEYFVRQQYKDILGREPDEGGFNYWSDQILGCGSDTRCVSTRRSEVAAAFFIEAEYQQTGSFIHNLYEGGLGRRPAYAEFSADRQQVVAGTNLETARQAFADSFVGRAEFLSRYQQYGTADLFVDALLANVRQVSGVDLDSQRAALISRYNSGASMNQSRSLVLRAVTEATSFRQAEYNPAFVLTEYFGYLLRDPDQGGYSFWLDVLNNHTPNNYRSMVCAFVTSREYQERFSRVVTHSNAECGQ